MSTFIPLKYLVNNGYIHLLSINFFYRKVNHLLKYPKKALFLYYLKDVLTRFSFLSLDSLLIGLGI